jgi:D-allulose-6-phosphate 3-epimerase
MLKQFLAYGLNAPLIYPEKMILTLIKILFFAEIASTTPPTVRCSVPFPQNYFTTRIAPGQHLSFLFVLTRSGRMEFKMRYEFSPSLMCMDLLDIKNQINFFNSRADFLHIDIMDGHFVKNFSLFPDFIHTIKEIAEIPIDAHLMVEDPECFLDVFAKSGADYITVHAETIKTNAFSIIDKIKRLGCKIGIALNPETALSDIDIYSHLIDKITFLTVDPGFSGQRFIPEVLDKITHARQNKVQNKLKYLLEVDGSCNQKSYKCLAEAGAEVFVVGYSGLFNLDKDIGNAWDKMMFNFNSEICRADHS